jgi:cytoskeletal protein CcmA (bactofilin family)
MKYRLRSLRMLLACLLFCAGIATAARGDAARDLTQVGSNITVGPGQEVGEATCFGCSIRVRGRVAGDVTAFGGSIVVEDEGQIGGDATTFAGSIRLGKEVKVRGDVTVFGGRIQRDPAAAISGDLTTMGGPGWMIVIVLAPFIIFGLFVALIVWVIRRVLRPSVPATA